MRIGGKAVTDAPNDNGDYAADLRDKIRAAHAKVTQLEGDRDKINADIEAEVSGLEAAGIGRRAFKSGRAWAMLDQEQRKAEDVALDQVKLALAPAVDLLGAESDA